MRSLNICVKIVLLRAVQILYFGRKILVKANFLTIMKYLTVSELAKANKIVISLRKKTLRNVPLAYSIN